MTDSYGRTIDYLRVSVTDRCNLRCTYCESGIPLLPPSELLTLDEILRICAVFTRLGVTKFKVTGGEPLLREGISGLIASLKRLPAQVTLTTNGVLLGQCLPELLSAGLDGVNISLDTLKPQVYRELNGGSEHMEVLRAIDTCVRSALPVKLNCVPVLGVNEPEVEDIAGLARDRALTVRFIERMPLDGAASGDYVRSEAILRRLTERYGQFTPCGDVIGNGPARYVTFKGFAGRIGFISPVSEGFCQSCNRVRLTADGQLKLCLAQSDGADLKQVLRAGLADSEIEPLIVSYFQNKPRGHDFGQNHGITAMRRTGG